MAKRKHWNSLSCPKLEDLTWHLQREPEEVRVQQQKGPHLSLSPCWPVSGFHILDQSETSLLTSELWCGSTSCCKRPPPKLLRGKTSASGFRYIRSSWIIRLLNLDEPGGQDPQNSSERWHKSHGAVLISHMCHLANFSEDSHEQRAHLTNPGGKIGAQHVIFFFRRPLPCGLKVQPSINWDSVFFTGFLFLRWLFS